MVRFEVGFTPHPFQKSAVQQTKEDVEARLYGHHLERLKIVLKKPPGSNTIAFQFVGDPETVEKARRLLGIY